MNKEHGLLLILLSIYILCIISLYQKQDSVASLKKSKKQQLEKLKVKKKCCCCCQSSSYQNDSVNYERAQLRYEKEKSFWQQRIWQRRKEQLKIALNQLFDYSSSSVEHRIFEYIIVPIILTRFVVLLSKGVSSKTLLSVVNFYYYFVEQLITKQMLIIVGCILIVILIMYLMAIFIKDSMIHIIQKVTNVLLICILLSALLGSMVIAFDDIHFSDVYIPIYYSGTIITQKIIFNISSLRIVSQSGKSVKFSYGVPVLFIALVFIWCTIDFESKISYEGNYYYYTKRSTELTPYDEISEKTSLYIGKVSEEGGKFFVSFLPGENKPSQHYALSYTAKKYDIVKKSLEPEITYYLYPYKGDGTTIGKLIFSKNKVEITFPKNRTLYFVKDGTREYTIEALGRREKDIDINQELPQAEK